MSARGLLKATTPEAQEARRAAAFRARRAADKAANRARVLRALDAMRASGVPKSRLELAAETGLGGTSFTKHSRAYVLGISAELLGAEVLDDEAFHAWRALYRLFMGWIRVSGQGGAVQARLLRLAIESLERAGQPVAVGAVWGATGVDRCQVAVAIRAWAAETGREAVRARSWQPVTLAMVLPLVGPELHELPFTFLEDPRAHRPMDTWRPCG